MVFEEDQTGNGKPDRPLSAIRKQCLECTANQIEEVRLCPVTGCALYNYRFGRKASKELKSALKAIKEKCLECSYWQVNEVRNCEFTDCALYQYRQGHNPARKGKGGKGIFIQKTTTE